MTTQTNVSAPGRPRASRPARSRINDRLLSASDDASGSTLLHIEVQQRLERLWQTGGRRGGTGRRPEWISIRPAFLKEQPDSEHGPVLPRLVRAKGLALRLELLMLFDAQCRFEPGQQVHLGRTVEAAADQSSESWQGLVLADSTGDYRDAPTLRARQIRDALRVLDDQHHLVRVGKDNRRQRRDYDKVTLLSEASTPTQRPPYAVPAPGGLVRISRHFFTSLWVFALTNTEIAAFLALSAKRADFPLTHTDAGVYAPQSTRQRQFALKENTWRSARSLYQFRLLDRKLDPNRDPRSGIIADFGARWKKHEVMPTTFTIADGALEKHAVPTIDQILNHETVDDMMRLERTGHEIAISGTAGRVTR
ncbi:hypothetical protein AB0F72_03615 [Actinoplanes sp. NPDC023936]|uniref:hypothetical protein n=1 Tax=Actinoplanes sp. NPDC023936 TaxID=3154910 RepID=UPI0033FEB476